LRHNLAAWGLGAFCAAFHAGDAPAQGTHAPRIEVRSASFLAVGLVDHDRMTVRLSRLADNAPVTDAAVSVKLRGSSHATTAQPDGSYAFESKDLALPGPAAVQINVQENAVSETLAGTLQVGADSDAAGEDKNNARQLWWWVLNFAVGIGFVWLISRRRKKAEE
jgi:hypothetical protein